MKKSDGAGWVSFYVHKFLRDFVNSQHPHVFCSESETETEKSEASDTEGSDANAEVCQLDIGM